MPKDFQSAPLGTRVSKGKEKAEAARPRLFLKLTKRSYCPGGGPSISPPYLAAMAAICRISASSGSSSGETSPFTLVKDRSFGGCAGRTRRSRLTPSRGQEGRRVRA
jgi:hypothetical protein